MTLLDAHPERFGWRYWMLAAEPFFPSARLLSPMHARKFDGPRIDAHCRHGNQPPSADCPCGVHFVPSTHSDVFIPWICGLINRRPPRDALTFGLVHGGIMDDPDAYFGGGVYQAKRAAGYQILTIFLHEEHAQLPDDLRETHCCPVNIGISEPHVRRALLQMSKDIT